MAILNLIRWLKGYVALRLEGEEAAAFMGFLVKCGVPIWGVTRKKTALILYMPISYYRHIIRYRHEFNGKIRIIHLKQYGLYTKTRILIKRKSLIAGVFTYSVVMLLMSLFIWQINIVGNETVKYDDITNAYHDLGVTIGMKKSELDIYKLREVFPLKVKGVSWCSFNLEGSCLTINITETKETDKTVKNEYSNLVASYDGIIKKIDIISGNKSVSVGDVVSKGEVLVSGAPFLNMQNFTYSEGTVIAETLREFIIKIPKHRTVYKKCDTVVTKNIVDIFGFKIPLYLDNVHYKYISEFSEKYLNFFGNRIPVGIITRRFYRVDEIIASIEENEAKNEVVAALTNEIKKNNIIEVKVIKEDIVSEESGYSAVFQCVCLENIAKTTKINVSS